MYTLQVFKEQKKVQFLPQSTANDGVWFIA